MLITGFDVVSNSATATTQQRETQVMSAINKLGQDIGRLGEMIDVLQANLQPILRNPSPQEKEQAEKQNPLVPLAETILYLASQVTDKTMAIEDMINRLEI